MHQELPKPTHPAQPFHSRKNRNRETRYNDCAAIIVTYRRRINNLFPSFILCYEDTLPRKMTLEEESWKIEMYFRAAWLRRWPPVCQPAL